MMIAQIVQKLFGPLPAGLAKDGAGMPPAPGTGDFGLMMQAAPALPADIAVELDEAQPAALFDLGLLLPLPAPPSMASAAQSGPAPAGVSLPSPAPLPVVEAPPWAGAMPQLQPPPAQPQPAAETALPAAPPPMPQGDTPQTAPQIAPPISLPPQAALFAADPADLRPGLPAQSPLPAQMAAMMPAAPVQPAPAQPLAAPAVPIPRSDQPSEAEETQALIAALPRAKPPQAIKPPLAAPRAAPEAAADAAPPPPHLSTRHDGAAQTPAAGAVPAAAARPAMVGPVMVGPAGNGAIPAPALWTMAQAAAPLSPPKDHAQDRAAPDAPQEIDLASIPLATAGPASAQLRQATQVQAFERYLFEQRSDIALADLPAAAATPQGEGRSGAPSIGPSAAAGPQLAPSQPLAAQILPHAAAAQSGPVEVLLSPQELGHLRFEIQHRGEGVQILLSAERLDTMDLLRRNGDQLLADFRQAGFAGASLSFGQWGGASQRQAQADAALRDDLAPLAADAPGLPPPAPFIPPRAYSDPSRALNLRL